MLNITGKPDAMSTWDGALDLNEQDVLKEDCRFQAGTSKFRIFDNKIILQKKTRIISWCVLATGLDFKLERYMLILALLNISHKSLFQP